MIHWFLRFLRFEVCSIADWVDFVERFATALPGEAVWLPEGATIWEAVLAVVGYQDASGSTRGIDYRGISL